MKFCCKTLKSKIKQEPDEHILYLPQTRTFQIIGLGLDTVDISYCPWCGNKLPDDLTDQLVNIIYEELKLDSYNDPRLPKQFKSNRWWVDLGL
jgi:hypothetical protein